MSLKTWKAEFYPETAKAVVRRTKDPRDIIAHGVLKWSGLTAEALKIHGLTKIEGEPLVRYNASKFLIDTSTCALCELYYELRSPEQCRNCPLYKSRGCVACDERVTGEPADYETDAPWVYFVKYNDPRLMQRALEDAMNWLNLTDGEPAPQSKTSK
jgi:hypothetical protein